MEVFIIFLMIVAINIIASLYRRQQEQTRQVGRGPFDYLPEQIEGEVLTGGNVRPIPGRMIAPSGEKSPLKTGVKGAAASLKSSPVKLKTPKAETLMFKPGDLVKGIIFSEIIGPPRSRLRAGRKYGPNKLD